MNEPSRRMVIRALREIADTGDFEWRPHGAAHDNVPLVDLERSGAFGILPLRKVLEPTEDR